MKKRAQGWGMDIAIGASIFLIGIASFFIYTFNYNTNTQETLSMLNYDAEIVSDSLLSEGYPKHWTTSNVISLGLTTNDKINQTKLDMMYSLNNTNYIKTKTLLSTKFNYFFNFSEPMTITGVNDRVVGIGAVPMDQKDLIKITRFTVYKNKPVSMNIYIWR